MKNYWLKDLKDTEEALYVGHVSSYDMMTSNYDALTSRLQNELKEGRIVSLRDLEDEMPVIDGSYYGSDIYAIVKKSNLKKQINTINTIKEIIKEWNES